MASYADIDDDYIPRVATPVADEDKPRIALLLEDASFWLNVWVDGLETSTSEQVAQAAKLLVIAMVKRSLSSPSFDDGVASVSQSAMSFQNVVTYRNPDGNLYLYERELEAIRSLLRPSRATAVSYMSPGFGSGFPSSTPSSGTILDGGGP